MYTLKNIQTIKNILDNFVIENWNVESLHDSTFISLDGVIVRAYVSAFKHTNKDWGTWRIPSSQTFFQCLWKVIYRGDRKICRTPFWKSFFEELFQEYPEDNISGYRIIDYGTTIIYKGEDEYFPWVVSQQYHPEECETFLDRTIGEEVFDGGKTIEDLLSKYGDLNPRDLAKAIQDERDTSNWYPSEE